MKRKITILVFILFSGVFAANGQGQAKLITDTIYSVTINKTIFGPWKYTYIYVWYRIKNIGSKPYTLPSYPPDEKVYSNAILNHDTAEFDILSDYPSGNPLPKNMLGVGDTADFFSALLVDSTRLLSGANANIVVIWPTGNGYTNSISAVSNGDSAHFSYNVTTTGINTPPSLNNALKFYPNPAANTINISYNNNSLTIKNIELINISGEKVNNYSFDGNSLDLSQVSAGVYFLQVMFSDGETGTYKILKAAN